MSWITSPLLVLLPYVFLYLSVILLWKPGKGKVPRWVYTLAVAIFLGLLTHQIEIMALYPIILLSLAVYCWQYKKTNSTIRWIAFATVFLVGYGMIKHILPGFHRFNVLNQVRFSNDAVPFSLNLDFEKTIVGILMLGLGAQLISKKNDWKVLFQQLLKNAPIFILVVMIGALKYRVVAVDVKFPDSILIWSVVNLLCVSVAEEAYYRGFIQKTLSSLMGKTKHGNNAAIVIAGLMFGLDHYPASVNYISVVTVAGVGYGWIYFITKRIEGSILTHFSMNLIHFIFFTYPVLA